MAFTGYHVAVFYQQKGDRTGGWTTNFWNSASDDPTIIAATNKLVALLENLAGEGCNVSKARYAQTPAFRVADEILYQYATTVTGSETADADYQNTAVGVVMQGAGKYKVNIWLSGNSDSSIAKAGRLQPRFAASPQFKALATYLTRGGDGWTLRVKDKARPKKKVTVIAANGTITCPNHGFDGTNTVTISRVKGPGRPRGSWAITNITTNTFDLVGFTIPVPAALNIKTTIAREDIFTSVPIISVVAKRATSHRRGRPTDLLSGKPKKLV
jgi:hypothetical protein